MRFAAVVPRRAMTRVRLARHGPLEFRAHHAEASEAAAAEVGSAGDPIGLGGGLGRRRAGNFDSAAAGRHADQERRPEHRIKKLLELQPAERVRVRHRRTRSTNNWPTASLSLSAMLKVAQNVAQPKAQDSLHAVDVGARRVALQHLNLEVGRGLAVVREDLGEARREGLQNRRAGVPGGLDVPFISLGQPRLRIYQSGQGPPAAAPAAT